MDYVEYTLLYMEGDEAHDYLDRQTLKIVIVAYEMMAKAKNTFMERIEDRGKKR